MPCSRGTEVTHTLVIASVREIFRYASVRGIKAPAGINQNWYPDQKFSGLTTFVLSEVNSEVYIYGPRVELTQQLARQEVAEAEVDNATAGGFFQRRGREATGGRPTVIPQTTQRTMQAPEGPA